MALQGATEVLLGALNPGIDFLLSAKRDKKAARRFFRQALDYAT